MPLARRGCLAPRAAVRDLTSLVQMSDVCSTMTHMQTVTKRDLNQHTASVLDRVTDTGAVVVTERGEPRWLVSPFRGQDAPLVRMERDGRYTPRASTPAPWPSHPGGPAYTDAEVGALLDEMHGDR